MERPDDEVWADAANSGRIDGAVLVRNDVAEVDAFGHEMSRNISSRQKSLIDGCDSSRLQFARHLQRKRLDRAGAEEAYRHTFIHDFGTDRFLCRVHRVDAHKDVACEIAAASRTRPIVTRCARMGIRPRGA